MSIPVREALTRCVAENIISYIQENQILIGQIGEQLFSYDIKHNFIKPY